MKMNTGRLSALKPLTVAMILTYGTVASATFSEKDYGDPHGNTHVVCLDDPSQTYELYIPPTAPTTTPSPILYCFDPGGNGKGILLAMADAALEHGWIVAASNNSRNGPWQDIFDAQDAIMHDTEQRLNLHPTRRFATGFSGGARAALALAFRYPDNICGVLCLGAGGPNLPSLTPSTDRLIVHLIIGTSDSNYTYDIPRTQGKLVANGIRCTVQEWSAGHIFPPHHLIAAGCRWLADNAEIDPNDGLPSPACPEISLFCQAPVEPYDVWSSYLSDTETGHTMLESFDGITEAIANVDWWVVSGSYHDCVGYWIPQEPTTNEFIITLFEDAGDTYGAVVHQETVVAERTDLPHLYLRNYPLRQYTSRLSAPVMLTDGWVRIEQVRSSADPNAMWVTSNEGDGRALQWDSYFGGYFWADDDLSLSLSPVDIQIAFYCAPSRGKPPLNVKLTGSVSGNYEPVTNWHWDLGDGEIRDGNDSIITHEYQQEGSYTVTLTVTVGEEVITLTKENAVFVSHEMPVSTPFSLLVLCTAFILCVGVYMGNEKRRNIPPK